MPRPALWENCKVAKNVLIDRFFIIFPLLHQVLTDSLLTSEKNVFTLIHTKVCYKVNITPHTSFILLKGSQRKHNGQLKERGWHNIISAEVDFTCDDDNYEIRLTLEGSHSFSVSSSFSDLSANQRKTIVLLCSDALQSAPRPTS